MLPRISLRTFLALDAQEKYAQLDELANIVLGIRVFNQYTGNGGTHLSNPAKEALALLDNTCGSFVAEIESVQRTCIELQDVVLRGHLQQPPDSKLDRLRRWKDELTNRRQYLSYLQSLQEDMTLSKGKVSSLQATITSDVNDLQELIGSRSSVPKDYVYPKFYEIAAQWTAAHHEKKVVAGRVRTAAVLQRFRDSYTPSRRYETGQVLGPPRWEEDRQQGTQGSAGTVDANNHGEYGDDRNGRDGRTLPTKSQDKESTVRPLTDHTSSERPVKLSIESTPEFMQLPLEYQGFCSWTIVERQGLLLPGKPELGVIRYKNRFYVFAQDAAATSFIDDPERFIKGTIRCAAHSPELIHLLRLQDNFPAACITSILHGEGSARGPKSLALSAAQKRDASTETPVHFLTKSIQVSYHWNEWALRQRALQMANLFQCATTSQQTDASHRRRVNDSQVYPKREASTQTRRTTGTRPIQHVQYFAGKMLLAESFDATWFHIEKSILFLPASCSSCQGHETMAYRGHRGRGHCHDGIGCRVANAMQHMISGCDTGAKSFRLFLCLVKDATLDKRT